MAGCLRPCIMDLGDWAHCADRRALVIDMRAGTGNAECRTRLGNGWASVDWDGDTLSSVTKCQCCFITKPSWHHGEHLWIHEEKTWTVSLGLSNIRVIRPLPILNIPYSHTGSSASTTMGLFSPL